MLWITGEDKQMPTEVKIQIGWNHHCNLFDCKCWTGYDFLDGEQPTDNCPIHHKQPCPQGSVIRIDHLSDAQKAQIECDGEVFRHVSKVLGACIQPDRWSWK